jgi:hypothetical protein
VRFPEGLYRPGNVVRELRILAESTTTTGTVANVNADVTNPDDNYAWVVTHVLGVGIPEGAELVSAIQLQYRSPSLDTTVRAFNLRQDDTDGAVATRKSTDWQGEIIMPPLWTMRCAVTKSAAVSNVTVGIVVLGYRIPLGNIVR